MAGGVLAAPTIFAAAAVDEFCTVVFASIVVVVGNVGGVLGSTGTCIVLAELSGWPLMGPALVGTLVGEMVGAGWRAQSCRCAKQLWIQCTTQFLIVCRLRTLSTTVSDGVVGCDDREDAQGRAKATGHGGLRHGRRCEGRHTQGERQNYPWCTLCKFELLPSKKVACTCSPLSSQCSARTQSPVLALTYSMFFPLSLHCSDFAPHRVSVRGTL